MATKRESWREWERRVEAWRRSEESATTFAARHGWSARTLEWWASVGLARKKRQESLTTFTEIVPTETPPPKARASRIEIILTNGRRVRVGDGFPASDLRALLALLEA